MASTSPTGTEVLAGVQAGESETLVDASIASATGASQIIAAANPARLILNISNPSAVSWWINETGGVAVANGAGCFELAASPNGRWTPRPSPVNAVTGIATAGTKLTVVTD